jgi:hypothetical protein
MMRQKTNIEFINSMFLDLKESNEKFKTVKFFRKNIQTVAIWLYVLGSYFKKKNINIEDVYNEVNQIQRTSKPSVKNYLDEAKGLNFLIFENSIKDKRSKNITPSELTINEFLEWKKLFD